jgi:hypothetical protein
MRGILRDPRLPSVHNQQITPSSSIDTPFGPGSIRARSARLGCCKRAARPYACCGPRVDSALKTIKSSSQLLENSLGSNSPHNLVALRESQGLALAQLANRLGITQSPIAQLESAQPKMLS